VIEEKEAREGKKKGTVVKNYRLIEYLVYPHAL